MYTGLKEFKKDFLPLDRKIAVIASEFNQYITDMLHGGSMRTLVERGISIHNIHSYWVPGAFEIPLTCKKVFDKDSYDGIIALGSIIRGETPHFDYVAGGCAQGVLEVSMEYNKPVIFGVLTTDTVEQAINRSGLKSGNKGSEAAHSLLNLLSMYQKAEL